MPNYNNMTAEEFVKDFLANKEKDYGVVSEEEGKEILERESLPENKSQKFHVIIKITETTGISVVRSSISYGSDDGLFEAALMDLKTKELCYRDDFFDGDVGGYLTAEDVEAAIEKVKTF